MTPKNFDDFDTQIQPEELSEFNYYDNDEDFDIHEGDSDRDVWEENQVFLDGFDD